MSQERTAAQRADPQRIVSTHELFEQYWVAGKPLNDLPMSNVTQRGIPTRSQTDALALKHGDVQVHELWDEYLTDFQISLAQEIRQMRNVELLGETA